jgi:3-dehydroquinate synthase
MASTATPTEHLLRTRDAIALPGAGRPIVEARAARSDAYPIHVTRSPSETVDRVCDLIGGADVAVVTDDVVMDLHGGTFVAGLQQRLGRAPEVAVVPAGEGSKSLEQATRLWHWLAAGRLGRRDIVVTFGGGVVNDLGGWVASGYMRGMRYVNVPTTLVGQVDAGIGGKLAVNHRSAKNLIGGFHQPTGVVSNIGYLRTLDGRQLRAGIAETVKKALIASPDLWRFIEANAEALLAGDDDALERLVVAAGVIKAELIARDPYEHDARRTLGFGHALAHPLETVTGYGPILHGEAVAFGMAVEARMALARGLLPRATFARIITLLRRLSLPTVAAQLPVAVDGRELLAATEKVRLARGGSLRWVLPLGLGDTVIADDVAGEELVAALRRAGVTVAR